ncbi:MAG TPA: carboxypeptidase-like regulatory domain-containing protein [Phycisphaerae bacterium]|nr:carboxypeptidase-like regulatory domain-containing protein [Phycisphaerae bacterium]HNU45864.1 carboxypeptidase-like regulatory domain-containing protein [Phycisphaerae bacterium]
MSHLRLLAALPVLVAAATTLAQAEQTEPLKPLTVVVVDAETGKPILVFDCFYRVEAASGYKAGGWEWIAAKSEAGAVTLDVPASCELTFAARAFGYVYDTFCIEQYPIMADDTVRRIRHPLQRGITVTGLVVDAATCEPVAGVRVSPTVFHNPSFDPDHDRSVFSQADGRFEIFGINPTLGSIAFEHADYLEAGWYPYDFESDMTRPASDITVQLAAGDTILGVVRGPNGEPIAGATVDSGDGKKTQTRPDGTFRIRGVRKHWGHGDFYVDVEKSGFMRYWKTPHSMPEDGFQITLEPLFEIHGRVVDSNGLPVRKFAVMAGPGGNPDPCSCTRADVTDDEGRFSIAIDTRATWLGGVGEDGRHSEPRHWLAVWADGYAVWEDLVPFDRAGAAVSVALRPGVVVSGRLSGIPAGFGGGLAELVLERPPQEYTQERTAPQDAGTVTTSLGPDGAFRFAHVRPDKYALHVSGRGITPRAVAVEVPPEDLAIDPIEVQRTGRVVGRIFTRQGKPWAFADGALYHPALGTFEERRFKAAEDGRFALEDVPAGGARIGAQYLGGDIIWADLVSVNVVPGGEVSVVINNPERSRDVKFRIEIGDGSEAQRLTGTGMAAKRLVKNVTTRDPAFRVELEPLAAGSPAMPDMFDWRPLDADGFIWLWNVPAGAYRLHVYDWLQSRGFRDGLLYQANVEVQPGVAPFRVPLGAGAITGQMKVSNPIRRMPQVIAVETHGRTHPRRARCDDDGDFCVRYLPPGEYVLYGHEDANGCCRLPVVPVSDDITDVGEHQLTAGATVRGTVRVVRATGAPTAVRATDAGGVALEAIDFTGRNGEEYAISNLWPGTWTVTLERGGEILVQKTVELTATEVTALDLTVE